MKLFLARLFYGKFSFEYQRLFVKKNPQKISNKKFLKECSKINGFGHLSNAFEHSREITVTTTNTIIKFHNISNNDNFWRFLKKNKDYICYDIEKYENHYWKRLAYRDKAFNRKVKTIYHFLDDKFFFGEFFFPDARNLDITMIRKMLCEKYGLPEEGFGEKFKIRDNDAFIFFEYTGIILSIKYVFTSNKDVILFLNQFGSSKILTTPDDNLVLLDAIL